MPDPSSDGVGAETAVGAVGPDVPHAAIPSAADTAAVTEPRIRSMCLNVIVHLVEEPESLKQPDTVELASLAEPLPIHKLIAGGGFRRAKVDR